MRSLGVAVVALLTVVLAACAPLRGDAPAPGSPARTSVEELLARVRMVDARGKPGGYERGCKPGQGCVFGAAWSDDTDAPDGHDGCGTRDNVLAQQLRDVVKRGNCVVVGGVLADAYTGTEITFTKADAGAVQIDHVFPLAAAWDLGANAWSLARRARFANDTVVNLLAVSGRANQDKGDKTPGSWLPPAGSSHCFYAAKYLTVAVSYDLPITAADRARLAEVAKGCP
nr:HNH endonuclease family protein [Nocardia camponoti]